MTANTVVQKQIMTQIMEQKDVFKLNGKHP